MMKKMIVGAALAFASMFSASAQTGINYQAVVRDGSGAILANQSTTVVFSILEDSASGSTVYSESQSLTTNAYGNLVAVIGQGSATTGTFSTIDWSANDHFLNVTVDGTDMGTTQFMSVPYAMSTEKAKMIDKTHVKVNANGDGKVRLGYLPAASGAQILEVTDYEIATSPLVLFEAQNVESGEKILKLNAVSSSGNGRLIYGEANGTQVFRVDADGYVRAESSISAGGSVFTDGSVYADDHVNAGGNVKVTGEVNRPSTGTANLVPIAYGNVNSDGTIYTSSGNVTITKTGTGLYEIHVAGSGTVNYGNTIASIVVESGTPSVGSLSAGQEGLNLNIRNFTTGDYVDRYFQFVIYKP